LTAEGNSLRKISGRSPTYPFHALKEHHLLGEYATRKGFPSLIGIAAELAGSPMPKKVSVGLQLLIFDIVDLN